MPDGSQRDMCEGNRWLWCDSDVQDNAETSWKFVPEATIIGTSMLKHIFAVFHVADVFCLARST